MNVVRTLKSIGVYLDVAFRVDQKARHLTALELSDRRSVVKWSDETTGLAGPLKEGELQFWRIIWVLIAHKAGKPVPEELLSRLKNDLNRLGQPRGQRKLNDDALSRLFGEYDRRVKGGKSQVRSCRVRGLFKEGVTSVHFVGELHKGIAEKLTFYLRVGDSPAHAEATTEQLTSILKGFCPIEGKVKFQPTPSPSGSDSTENTAESNREETPAPSATSRVRPKRRRSRKSQKVVVNNHLDLGDSYQFADALYEAEPRPHRSRRTRKSKRPALTVVWIVVACLATGLLLGGGIAFLVRDRAADTATAGLVEMTRRTYADLEAAEQRYRQLVEQQLPGLSSRDFAQFQQHTDRETAALAPSDSLFQLSSDVATTKPYLTTSIPRQPAGLQWIWMIINDKGDAKVVSGSFNQQTLHLTVSPGRADLFVIFLAAPGQTSVGPSTLEVSITTHAEPPAVESELPELLIPTYFYPDSDVELSKHWANFRRFHNLIGPYAETKVVLNVFNGSGFMDPKTGERGNYPDENYRKLVAELDKRRIPWLGYVTYRYGSPRQLSMEADFDRWLSAYPSMGGVFVDEVPSGVDSPEQLQQFCAHVRSAFRRHGKSAPVLLANTGTTCPTVLLGPQGFNWACVDENPVTASVFNAAGARPAGVAFGALLHSASGTSEVMESLTSLTSANADFLFITDELKIEGGEIWKRMPRTEFCDAITEFYRRQWEAR